MAVLTLWLSPIKGCIITSIIPGTDKLPITKVHETWSSKVQGASVLPEHVETGKHSLVGEGHSKSFAVCCDPHVSCSHQTHLPPWSLHMLMCIFPVDAISIFFNCDAIDAESIWFDSKSHSCLSILPQVLMPCFFFNHLVTSLMYYGIQWASPDSCKGMPMQVKWMSLRVSHSTSSHEGNFRFSIIELSSSFSHLPNPRLYTSSN